MEEEKIAAVWVGPNGTNSVLGTVTRNGKMDLSESDFEYFHSLNLVKKAPKKTSETDVKNK